MLGVVVLHSALGKRANEADAVRRLQGAGLEVTAPDLYHGTVVDTYEQGVAVRDRIKRDVLLARAAQALPAAPDRLAIIGFSLGAALGQELAATDARVDTLVLIAGASDDPPAAPQPSIQFHAKQTDDWIGSDADIDNWAATQRTAGAHVDIYRYRGAGHLFTDSTLDAYDADAADLLWRRALALLHRRS